MEKRRGRVLYFWKKLVCAAAGGVMLLRLIFPAWMNAGVENYQICGQFSFGGGDSRQTVIHAVVNPGAWTDAVADEIIREHRRVNGEASSDRIVLRLYRGMSALRRGESFREFQYDVGGTPASAGVCRFTRQPRGA